MNWVDEVVPRIIQRAARNAPQGLSERLAEEWSADVSERPRRISRLSFALGCYWAATVIRHDHCTVNIAAASAPTGDMTMAAYSHQGVALFSRRTSSSAHGTVMCDINITPLIDVMLVLLVTLIVSLPIMTHAVKLDLPRAPPSSQQPRPEIIDLDIDFDGTLMWNGTAIAGLQQLENYFQIEAQKNPQPQIHLRPDRRVKYDYVARVLASAQHNRMRNLGIVNTTELD